MPAHIVAADTLLSSELRYEQVSVYGLATCAEPEAVSAAGGGDFAALLSTQSTAGVGLDLWGCMCMSCHDRVGDGDCAALLSAYSTAHVCAGWANVC